MANRFELTDDGTMDTVVRCSECGEELRYNVDPEPDDYPNEEVSGEDAYAEFVEWAKADAAEQHICGEEETE